MTEITLGITLRGDSSGLVGEIRVSEDEMRKLGTAAEGTERKVTSLGERMTRSLAAGGRRLRSIGRSLTASVTLPLLAAGTAITSVSARFETSLSQIVGLVGLTAEEVDAMREGVLALAGETGRGPAELAEALFFVTSAGARGQEALDILRASAQAAAAGLGETAGVADAVTSAINAYGGANLDAATATGILVAAVREGKTSAETLSPVLGRVLPLASQLGVEFDEVAASIAAMSRLGLNAAESSTALRGVLAALLDPGTQAAKMLQDFGLSSETIQTTLRQDGLLATLTLLKETFGDNQQAMAAVFPEIEGLTGVLNLVGDNAEQTRQIFASLAQATGEDLARAFGVAAGDEAVQLQQSMARIQVQLIRLGEALLPVLVPAIEKLVDVIVEAVDQFAALDPAMQETAVLIAAAFAVGGPALIALGAAAAAIAAIGIPAALVIAGITALGAAWIAFGDDIARITDQVVEKVNELFERWRRFETEVIQIVQDTVEGIQTWLIDRFTSIVDGVGEKIDEVTGFFRGMWEDVVGNSFVPDMIDAIEEHFGRLGRAMVDPAAEATGAAAGAFDVLEDGTRQALDRMAGDLRRGELSWRSFGETIASVVDDILNRLIGSGIDALVSAIFGPGGSISIGPSSLPGPTGGELAHGGGVIGQSALPVRAVDPSVFAGAPRLHRGLMPNEFAAILEDGEGVFTREQMRALGPASAGDFSVIINDQRGANAPDIGVERREGAGGGREVELFITEAVARDIGGNGLVSKAIQGRFGVRPQGVR